MGSSGEKKEKKEKTEKRKDSLPSLDVGEHPPPRYLTFVQFNGNPMSHSTNCGLIVWPFRGCGIDSLFTFLAKSAAVGRSPLFRLLRMLLCLGAVALGVGHLFTTSGFVTGSDLRAMDFGM